MEARTRDLLFGTGRAHTDLGGTFAPRGWAGGTREKGAVLSTFKGIGREGTGREAGLKLAERFGLITAEQRAASGPVGAAAEGAADSVRALVGGGAAASGAAAAHAGQQYANPVYGGLFAQTLMREQGFVPPTAPPDDTLLRLVDDAATGAPVEQAVAGAADDAAGTLGAAADDLVDDLVRSEQRLVESFQRLARLPEDAKVPALTRAVDASAVAGHGGDAFDVLGQALAARPHDAAASALDDAVEAALRAAPVADEAAKVAAPIVDDVAKVAAPIVDDAVKVAAPIVDDVIKAAVPKVVEAALPQVVASASATRTLLMGSDDALRGLMPFSAGVDDTLRLLAKF